ncbi:DUF418 domain-containing protein [Gracilibacillus dipsosauri]|uniref:DUF418 domain-containing protein n=1 Tax=Gracilibacillus dipsosauri TaxID=178340 RepID=UPI00240960F5
MSYHHQKRIRLLDIFRGIAILGTLGTNIWIFAYLGDISYIFTFDHYEWWSSIDHFIRILSLSLVNGKLLGLLAIMFGIGLELKYQQSLRKGRPWPGVYLWTSLFLLIEGFLHFTFVMEYDILMAYAIAAIIVAFIVKAGMKYIKRSMILIGVIHLLFILLLFLAGLTQQISGNFLGDMQETTYLYENKSWLDQIQYRLSNFLSLRGEAIFTIPLNVFLFLTGVLLMRKGAFANDAKGRYIRRKMLQIGLCVGLPLNLLLFVPGGLFDFPVRYLFAPILSIGYMGLIAFMVEKKESLHVWGILEKVGKASLSCYVMQNILCSIIFYGWGLGVAPLEDSFIILLILCLVSVVQVLFVILWLKFYKHGPMEAGRKFMTRLVMPINSK